MSNLSISPDALTQEIKKLLDEYGADVNRVLDEEIDKAAKDARRKIRAKTAGWGKGRYSRGWTLKKENRAGGLFHSQILYNKDLPGLPHLLEFSHEKKNKSGSYGRSTPRPHLAELNDWIETELPRRLMERINKIK